MAIRKNIFLDLTFLTTTLTVFTYISGNSFVSSFMRYFDYSEGALGLTLQEYLKLGGLNGFIGIFSFFLGLLIISLINTLCDKQIHISIFRGIAYFLLFPLVFIYNWIDSYGTLPTSWQLKISYLKQGSKNKIGHIVKETRPTRYLIHLVRLKTHIALYKFVDWKENQDHTNIEEGVKEFLRYYFYLILMYILVLTILNFFIGIENSGKTSAETSFKAEDKPIFFKDEIVQDYLNKNYKNISYPLKGKILICGSTNCLVAIRLKDYALKDKNSTENPDYLIKPIANISYLNFKNGITEVDEVKLTSTLKIN